MLELIEKIKSVNWLDVTINNDNTFTYNGKTYPCCGDTTLLIMQLQNYVEPNVNKIEVIGNDL